MGSSSGVMANKLVSIKNYDYQSSWTYISLGISDVLSAYYDLNSYSKLKCDS